MHLDYHGGDGTIRHHPIKKYVSLPFGPSLYEDKVYDRCDVLKQYTGHED